MATPLLSSDALVLYRAGDASSPYPGSFHFTLGDLGEFMTEEGFTVCYISDNIGNVAPVAEGSLVFDIGPGYKGDDDTPYNILKRWNGFRWDIVAPSSNLSDEYNFFVSQTYVLEQKAQDDRLKALEVEQITQNARLDDHDSELDLHNARLVALEAAAVKGVYQNPSTYPSPLDQAPEGKFTLTDQSGSNKITDYDNLSSGGRFFCNMTDNKGDSPDVSRVGEDDVIRINGPNSVGVTLKITARITTGLQPDVFGFDVTLVEKFDDVLFDTDLTVEFLQAFDPDNYVTIEDHNDAIADLEDRKLDKPYKTWVGNSIPATNPESGLPWEYGEQFFLTDTVEMMVWANCGGHDGWWPTFDQKQLEDDIGLVLETKVGKSGTSMLSNDFALKNTKDNGDKKSLITLVNSTDTNGKKLRLQWLTEPSGRGDAATKAYVDDTIAAQPSGFNPGDKVCADSSGDAEVGGFVLNASGSLYIKIS